MKILIVHNYYNIRGGEDVVFENEVDLLRQHGHKVHTIILDNKSIFTFWKKIETAFFLVYNPFWSKRIYKTVEQLKPDVVHIHNFFPGFSPSIFYALHRCGVPVILTLHNFRILCPTAFLYNNDNLRERSLHHNCFWTVLHRTYHDSVLGTFAVALMVELHKKLNTFNRKCTTLIALSKFAKSKFVEGGVDPNLLFVKGNFARNPGIVSSCL